MKSSDLVFGRRSLGAVLDDYRGFGPGFDFLRVALALSVVAWHAPQVAVGPTPLESSRLVWMGGYAILVMFFALSGFLITGSAQRLGIRDFLINRGLRIFPALIIEIVFSAFILGAIFTNLPLGEYFGRLQTYHYLVNITGDIQYNLPGVFKDIPGDWINGSLWTVPYEIGCYATMSVFIIYGLLKYPKIILGAAVFIVVIGLAFQNILMDLNPLVRHVVDRAFTSGSSRLVLSFVLGILIYLWRYKLPYDFRLFWVLMAYCLAISLLHPVGWVTQPLLNAFVAPALVYMTAFLGATKFPRLPIFWRGDYSYGIYLYAEPIQQAVRSALPWTNTGTLNFVASFPFIVAFAAFSWHCLEKPIMKLRKRFSFVARVRGVEGAGESLVAAPPPVQPDSPDVSRKISTTMPPSTSP